MTVIAPAWTDPASALVAPQILAKGNCVRTTLDLSAKVGASLACCVGRSHTTGLTGNFYIIVRRLYLTKTLTVPGQGVEYVGGSTTGSTTVAVQNTTIASAATVITMTATPTNFGSADQLIVWSGHTQPSGLTNSVTVQAEWSRLAARFNAVASSGGTTIYVDAPTKYARIASEVCINQAELMGPIWLPGGAMYEVIFDYAAATAGENLIVAAYAQTYDDDTNT